MSRCWACAVDKYGVTDGVENVDPQKPTLLDGHYLRNRSTLDIGVLGYIGIVQHKEHSPEVLSIPPGTPCICQLQSGGSSTVHMYTQTIHRTTQNKQYIQQHNNLGECGPCPVLDSYTLAFALQLRKKHGKISKQNK